MENYSVETVNKLIEDLKYIRDNGEDIEVSFSQYIEEIGRAINGIKYGKKRMDINIAYNDKVFVKKQEPFRVAGNIMRNMCVKIEGEKDV